MTWCRFLAPLLAPRHAKRHQPSMGNELTPKQGHALAQRLCALGRHTRHLHTLQAAQPRAERGHHGLPCCQHSRTHLWAVVKICMASAQSWDPQVQWVRVQSSKDELWKPSHVSSCSKAGHIHVMGDSLLALASLACSLISSLLSQRSSRHWKWPQQLPSAFMSHPP